MREDLEVTTGKRDSGYKLFNLNPEKKTLLVEINLAINDMISKNKIPGHIYLQNRGEVAELWELYKSTAGDGAINYSRKPVDVFGHGGKDCDKEKWIKTFMEGTYTGINMLMSIEISYKKD